MSISLNPSRAILPRHRLVLPLTMVDNSDLSPFRLTASSDSPYDKDTIPAIHFKQRGFVWPFMCSCFYSWFAFSSLWHFCGVLAGSPFNLPTQQLHPGAAQSTVCSSHAPHLTAFPVVSALRLRRVED